MTLTPKKINIMNAIVSENNNKNNKNETYDSSASSSPSSSASSTSWSAENENNHDFVQLIFRRGGPLGMEIYRHGNGVLSVRDVAPNGQAHQICEETFLKPDVFEGATVVAINDTTFSLKNAGLPLWRELRKSQRPKSIIFALPRAKSRRHSRIVAWAAAKAKAVGRGGIERANGVNKYYTNPKNNKQQVELIFHNDLLGIRVDNETDPTLCKVENFAKDAEAEQIAKECLLLNPKVFENASILAVNGYTHKTRDAMYDALRSTERPKYITFGLNNNNNNEQGQDEQEQPQNNGNSSTTNEKKKRSSSSPLFDITKTLIPAREPDPQHLAASKMEDEKSATSFSSSSSSSLSSPLSLSPSSSSDSNDSNAENRSRGSNRKGRKSGGGRLSSSSSLVADVFGKVDDMSQSMRHSMRQLTTLMDPNQIQQILQTNQRNDTKKKGEKLDSIFAEYEDKEETEHQDHQFICI